MSALAGRAALITGGGRGIGATTARALAEAGATVAVAARTRSQVDEVAEALRADGHGAFAFACDVTDPEQVQDTTRGAAEAMGGMDILVNNAGIAPSNPVGRISLEEWNRVLAVNATGTFLCTQAVLPGMLERGWGRVVNVASVAGLAGAKYIAAYTTSKHAQVGFTRAVATEVEGTGVTVNAVCPGYVDTPMSDVAVAGICKRAGVTEERALEMLLAHVGQTRLLSADEVARRIVALCGPGSEDVNGAAIIMDGRDAAPGDPPGGPGGKDGHA